MAAIFPFSDEQVREVADAIGIYCSRGGDPIIAARDGLKALARVLSVERKAEAPGCPTGYGYYQVRGVTSWHTVTPCDECFVGCCRESADVAAAANARRMAAQLVEYARARENAGLPGASAADVAWFRADGRAAMYQYPELLAMLEGEG